MNLIAFLSAFSQAVSLAKTVIPVIAAARKQADPKVSNTALTNTASVIAAVSPLVNAGEALSAQQVAAGGQPLTGIEKLAIAQNAMAQAHDVVTAAGGTTHSFDQVWVPANAAITLLCALKAPAADPAAVAK